MVLYSWRYSDWSRSFSVLFLFPRCVALTYLVGLRSRKGGLVFRVFIGLVSGGLRGLCFALYFGIPSCCNLGAVYIIVPSHFYFLTPPECLFPSHAPPMPRCEYTTRCVPDEWIAVVNNRTPLLYSTEAIKVRISTETHSVRLSGPCGMRRPHREYIYVNGELCVCSTVFISLCHRPWKALAVPISQSCPPIANFVGSALLG
ncbi:hypothetical protein CYLTODRAFT_84684 [Cylindrobasidium torrendii FP15055 ss-10]|uniref:Uncharacterized protein n=1 Tax=Cylindrobasidium torrendii FP15055 ss-10 TaxID=1314674 RepID=A0A0D7B3K4_9AGAR|nr:hypothetical protein CYLTODRAFT_84684 [Cylindrobasidium torrendii FP15055 ss-10]